MLDSQPRCLAPRHPGGVPPFMSRTAVAVSGPRPDLADQPLDNPDLIRFTGGSSSVLNGQ